MKYGIKTDFGWVQGFSEYTEHNGGTSVVQYNSYAEAEQAAHDAGWKSFSIEPLPENQIVTDE